MPTLRYADAIFDSFPQFHAWLWDAFVIKGPSCEELKSDLRAEQQTARERIGSTPLSEIPSIKAWHEAFHQSNLDPALYPTKAEALLQQVINNKEIPSTNNTLLDIGNLMSLRYAIPVTVFEMSRVADESLFVRFARGDEQFNPLESTEPSYPQKGEVIFTDSAHICHMRHWCWQQSAISAPQEGPQDVLLVFQAHHAVAWNDCMKMLKDAIFMMMRYAGGSKVNGMGGHIHTGEREHRL